MTVLRSPQTRRTQSQAAHRRLVAFLAFLSILALASSVAGLIAATDREGGSSFGDGLSSFGDDPAPPDDPPIVPAYRPLSEEVAPKGKYLAAKVAQEALTYSRGDSAAAIARRLKKFGARVAPAVLRPAVDPDSRSWAKTIYPQMSGITAETMGAMVVTQQRVEDSDGRVTSFSRVLDVRLVLTNGRWRLDELASVGGSPAKRTSKLSAVARQVLANRRIDLPDSARWDVLRGEVSDPLLQALQDASSGTSFRVAVLKTGHPPNVWATDTPSAHSLGLAADVWSVGGSPVLNQRETGSKAFALAESFVAGGALQVGSPWTFTTDGYSTFTDDVHQDHIHVQQN